MPRATCDIVRHGDLQRGCIFNIDNTAPSSLVGFPANGASLTSTAYDASCSGSPRTSAAGDRPGHVTLGSRQGRGRDPAGQRPILERRDLAGRVVDRHGTTSWSYGFSPAADDTYTVTSQAADKARREPLGLGGKAIDDTPPSLERQLAGVRDEPELQRELYGRGLLSTPRASTPSRLGRGDRAPAATSRPPLQLGHSHGSFTYTARGAGDTATTPSTRSPPTRPATSRSAR